jgi:obg-like ATPase 1
MAAPAAAAGGKKEEKPRRPFLGRPTNNVAMGIVGMPNIGKSTLFNTLTKMHVPAENYPFCTIEPHVAKVPVPDDRFFDLCKHFKPRSEVQAVLAVTDIAGLVKGAHEGKGLGNEFLSNIMAVDGIFHVCRAFGDVEVEHVEGSVEPTRDLQIISDELRLKDVQVVERHLATLERVAARGQDKSKKQEFATLQKVHAHLKAGKDARTGEWDHKDLEVLLRFPLLSAKPVVYLVNLAKEDFLRLKSKWILPIKQWVEQHDPGAPVIPFSAVLESELNDMAEEERRRFCEEKKVQSMLPKIIKSGYHALDLIHFFTCGEDEVRAWTIRRGTKAPQAAGTIHSDFEKGFICAECYNYTDFKEHGSEPAVKAAGKAKTKGKEYEVVDGDILFFKHN